MHVMGRQCGAESTAGIACSGLDPDALEQVLLHDLGIGDAVQSDPAREAEVRLARSLGHVTCNPHDDFLGDRLNRGRHVHVELLE